MNYFCGLTLQLELFKIQYNCNTRTIFYLHFCMSVVFVCFSGNAECQIFMCEMVIYPVMELPGLLKIRVWLDITLLSLVVSFSINYILQVAGLSASVCLTTTTLGILTKTSSQHGILMKVCRWYRWCVPAQKRVWSGNIVVEVLKGCSKSSSNKHQWLFGQLGRLGRPQASSQHLPKKEQYRACYSAAQEGEHPLQH